MIRNRINAESRASGSENLRNAVSENFAAPERALSDDDKRIARDVFHVAITQLGTNKEAAYALGISEGQLSEMKNDNRLRGDYSWVRICRLNRAAGISMIRALAKLVGGLEVRDVGRVDKNRLRKQLEMSLERNPAMLRVVLADAADALGIDEDEAASVWDGPSLVDAVSEK